MTIALTGAGANVAAAMHIAEDAEKITVDCSDLPGKVLPIVADIRDPEECKRVVGETKEKLGGVHMLVNNAGVGMLLVSDSFTRIPTKFWEVEVDTWRRIVDTNFNGAFQMTREVVPHFLGQNWGRIVNVTTSVHTMQRPGFSPYGSSKAALIQRGIVAPPSAFPDLVEPEIEQGGRPVGGDGVMAVGQHVHA